MSKQVNDTDFQLSTHRIEALGDGIFAIVMTLLILEIHVPRSAEISGYGGMLPAILALWPKFLSFAIGFVTLGVYWVAHHLHFHWIKKADRHLLWINILFYMLVSLMPFTTALVGEHWRDPVAVSLFGANMILVSLALYTHWAYATNGHRLVSPDINLGLVRTARHVILMAPAIYLAAIGLSFLSTKFSLLLYALVNLIYIGPGGIRLYARLIPSAITPDKPAS